MTRSITITLAALCGTLFTSNAAFAVDSLDADKDQFFTDASNPDEKDCDDTNPYVNPDAEEVYETTGEQIDNDCDPSTTATAPSTTCDAGYHLAIATVETCVADEPVVDAEAKACVDGGFGKSYEFYVKVRAACEKAGSEACTWHGATFGGATPSDEDKAKRCHAIEADGFTWLSGQVVTDAEYAVALSLRAQDAANGIRSDLEADIQAEVEARTADIARLEDLIASARQLAEEAVTPEEQAAALAKYDGALTLAGSLNITVNGNVDEGGNVTGVVADLAALKRYVETQFADVKADVAELKQRPGAYFFVGARGTVGGQKPLALSFRDWEDGEVIGSFDRLARGGFVAGGGVEMAWGADFGHVRLGALAQVDFLRERGDTPKGEERSYTGIQPALSTEVQGDVAGDFRLGAAVGAAYHVTGVKMLSDARASQWSARFQARAAYTVPGTKLTLTASPFVDIGSCGARGYGENGDVETVSIKGCTAGGLSLAIGAGN